MGIDVTAPVISRKEIRIEASLPAVWRIHTDVDEWTSWQPELTSARLETPGELRVGSLFRWQIAGMDITSTVTGLEPMRRIEWGGPANGITGAHVWSFTPADDGVLVHTAESWAGAPVTADVPRAQQLLDASLVTWLARLKATAEASVS
jgi:hypothetical protein